MARENGYYDILVDGILQQVTENEFINDSLLVKVLRDKEQ